jgi:hypothetical protein
MSAIDQRPDEDVLELAKGGDQKALLEYMRRQGEASPYYFSKVIAGYNEMTPDLHQPICNWLAAEDDRERGLLFPRKYFKSSTVKGYVLRCLTKPKGAERRFLFVGENEVVGAKNLSDIQWKFREDKRFQALYPHLIPADHGREWPSSSLTLPRSQSYDEPTIQSIGIGTKHTGFHYTDIILDDPIGWIAARSKIEMQKAIDWIGQIPGLLDSIEARQLYVGTRWKHGKADLPGWIMEELPNFKWLKRAAIEDGVSIFPPQIAASGKRVGYSIPDLMQMKKQMKTYLFNANMMNDPSSGEDTDFKPDWIKTYRISEDRCAAILGDTNERVELATLLRIGVHDPSSGGVSAESQNAIVFIGCDTKGRILVLDRWAKNCSFGTAVERVHVMNDKWRLWRMYYEAVGAHKEVGDKYKDRVNADETCRICKKIHKRLRPRPIQPPPGSKEDRIRDYAQVPFEEGRVYIGEWMTDLEKQITEFPFGELLDLFDALAYCIHYAKRAPRHDGGSADEDRPKSKGRQPEKRTHSIVDYGGYG